MTIALDTTKIDFDRISTPTKVIALLDEIRQERGDDYKYETRSYRDEDGDLRGGVCDYVRNGEASCIVGTALAKIGVPLEWLHQFDQDSEVEGSSSQGAGAVLERLENVASVNISTDTIRLMEEAQGSQDNGYPYETVMDTVTNYAQRWDLI